MTGASPSDSSSSSISRGLRASARPEREHLLLAAGQQADAAILELGERREVLVGDLGVEPLAPCNRAGSARRR